MLNDEQIEQYHRDGYILASGLFGGAQLDELEREFDAIIDRRMKNRARIRTVWQGDWNQDPSLHLISTHDLQAYSAAWTRALVEPAFVDTIAQVIGPNVQLHHTKMFQKPPEKGAGFPMHQDHPYFPHDHDTMIAAVIHLSEATEEMGCLCFYPGSHRQGPIETYKQPDGGPQNHYLDPADWPVEKATRCPARRGDVVIFSYLTIHGSAPNRSNRTRKTVLIQLRDPADRPTTGDHPSHGQGLMLGGVDPLEGRHAAGGSLHLPREEHTKPA
ncbi:MAG: phytanoyl-CoA dioxygenase [Phycisphaeraceae bacterium]|nr:phytanoyl-CoA dioxygenase [Phycisphaeraceae bacterium]